MMLFNLGPKLLVLTCMKLRHNLRPRPRIIKMHIDLRSYSKSYLKKRLRLMNNQRRIWPGRRHLMHMSRLRKVRWPKWIQWWRIRWKCKNWWPMVGLRNNKKISCSKLFCNRVKQMIKCMKSLVLMMISSSIQLISFNYKKTQNSTKSLRNTWSKFRQKQCKLKWEECFDLIKWI